MIKIYQKNITTSVRPHQSGNGAQLIDTLGLVGRAFVRRKIMLFSTIVLIITIPILYLVIKYQSPIEAAWMDDSWGYRKSIAVTNNTTQQTNVYISVTLDTSDTTRFQADCGDLRFTNASGKQLKYYIVSGCRTASNVIHVLLDVFPAGSQYIYYYYGNPSAANGFSSADFSTVASNYTVGSLGTEEKSVGPVAYWKFDEGYGTQAKDSTQNANNGTIQTSIWKDESMCVSGKCMYFNGTDEAVYAANNLSLHPDYFSISMWIKPDQYSSGTNVGYILADNYGGSTDWIFYLSNTGKLALRPHLGTDRKGNSTIPLNQWTHVAATYDGSTINLYVNGKYDGGGSSSGMVHSTSQFHIGGHNAGGWETARYKGFLDEVKIYPYARTAAQIKSDFASKGSGSVKGTAASLGSSAKNSDAFSNGLVGYWKSDEASGNGTDSSGNGNTTTVSGSNNYGSGKFGNGLRSGVATTNLVTNPSFETNLTSWSFQAGGGAGTFAANTTTSVFGSTNAKFSVTTVSSNYPRFYYSAGALTDGVVYTISWYGKADSAGSTLKTDLENSGNGTNCASAGTTYLTPTYTTSWTRYSYTFTFSATNCPTTTPILMFQYPAVQNYYFDGFQIEASSASTPYVDGSLGTGYSWSGTPHASTSIRTASTATTTTNINDTTGTIAYWFKSPSLDTSAQCPFGPTDGDTNGGTLFGLKSSGVFLTHKYASGVTVAPQYSSTLSNNTWYHVAYTWDNTTRKGNLYVNGALQQTVSYAQAITAGEYLQNLGTCTATGYTTFNGTLDDVRAYNRALSAREVSQLYNWAPGPVGYWNMDEGSGATANDISGNGANGTATGTTIVSGKFGKARQFTASDNVSATIVDPAYSNTIEAWIYPTTSAASKTIITTSKLTTDSSSKPIYGGCTGTALSLNQWTHITATSVDSTHCYLYQNGVQTATGGTGVTFGTSVGIGQSSFLGKIDEVKIYNYPRSSKQIVEDMNAGHPVGGSPVGSQVGYWKMDEGYGTMAYDQLGVSNGNIRPGTNWTNNGKFNKALDFLGTGEGNTNDDNAVVIVTDNNNIDLDLSKDFSLSVWIKPETYVCTAILRKQGQFELYRCSGASGGITIRTWTPTQTENTGSIAINNGEWSYIAVTYDKTTSNLKMYVNNKVAGAWTKSGTPSDTTQNLGIGAYPSGAYSFDGIIDELKFYNYALTEDEIKLDYNRGSAMVLGKISTDTDGSTPSDADSRGYCIPGDTTSCSAPVGEWKMDEKTGTSANDTSGNGNTGTLTNSPAWTTGKIGSAINFSGATNKYVNVTPSGTTLDLTSTGTLEAWVYSNSFDNWDIILARGNWAGGLNNYSLYYQSSSNQIIGEIANASTVNRSYIASASTALLNGWHHITFTWDGSFTRIYLDGKLSETARAQTINAAPSGNLGIGGNSGYAYNGKIDQVRIFNYARTAAQIAWDYNRGGPVGWWKFDECQGGTANDASGNANNGTITIGATVPQTSPGTCTDGLSTSAWYNGRTGKYNSSLNFDGVDDIVTIGDPSSGILDPGTNSFTYSLWVYIPSSAGSYDMPIFKGGSSAGTIGYDMELGTGGWGANISDVSTIKSVSLGSETLNQWVLLTVVIDRTSNKLYGYKNGVLTTTGTDITGLGTLSNSTSLTLSKNTYPFKGQLDDVKIFNYALTATQVKSLYNAGAAVQFAPITGSP